LLGNLMVLASECSESPACFERAWVDLIDLSDPMNPRLRKRLTFDGTRAAFASIVKLDDGRFLLFVAGRKSGNGWFYVSRDLEAWDLLGEVRTAWNIEYQNASLLKE